MNKKKPPINECFTPLSSREDIQKAIETCISNITSFQEKIDQEEKMLFELFSKESQTENELN